MFIKSRESPRFLALVCGLPGSGKSETAKRIADATWAKQLNTDRLRKQMFAEPVYSEQESHLLYSELLKETVWWLAQKQSVVLDGTFKTSSLRQKIREVADAYQVPLSLIHVLCNDEVLTKQRLEARRLTQNPSQAGWETRQLIEQEFESIVEPHLRVENNTANLHELDDLVTSLIIPYILHL